ncbi:Spermidine/putrescine import ATP-binding protein PotA [Acetatifactor muris]|uniref:Spermidine/putrescine import ATP-binding protein PotA n=1 Tax=Acetatifactor muris TaxID=879566 RepID=A0A2K4ZBX4_9FIRM|nr:ABC transporter ATP-binding protein [Acetatifactor muris]SOY27958.1 Spermidine/putrescine import ATP-binding protein PotA [Acetatifactor muris]
MIDKSFAIPYIYFIMSVLEKCRILAAVRHLAKEIPLLKNTIISLQNITVSYDGEQVLGGFNLEIHDGEFVTLLGPSGCGKTTVLRTIAGFIKPDAGDVFFNDRNITGLPPHRREVNTIFQKYALFPHLNVYENIAFGMRLKGRSEKEIKQTVHEMLAMVNLTGYAHRGIGQLSGGQQQRVAIARALANEPKVLLLDEPLGALDLKLRKDMQAELKKIQQQTGITFVFVTHDQEEALSMSDTVVVMDGGVIQQIGSPTDIYNEPKNAFVADFIGESNILDGVMLEDYAVRFAGHTFSCLDGGFGRNTPVDVVIRPEDIKVVKPDATLIIGDVTAVTFKGVHYEIIVDVAGFKWMIQSTECRQVGDHIGLALTPDDIHVMEKSEYSGVFGDYSTFSDEMEEDMNASEEAKASDEEDELTEAQAEREEKDDEI